MGGASATENRAKCFGTSSEEIDAVADVCRQLSFSKIDSPKILGKNPEFDVSAIHQNFDLDVSSRFFGSSVLLPR